MLDFKLVWIREKKHDLRNIIQKITNDLKKINFLFENNLFQHVYTPADKGK